MNKILYLIPLLLVIATVPAFAVETTIGEDDDVSGATATGIYIIPLIPDPPPDLPPQAAPNERADKRESGSPDRRESVSQNAHLPVITGTIDKSEYDASQTIRIEGQVVNAVPGYDLSFIVTNPSGEKVYGYPITISNVDGTFWKEIRPLHNIADWDEVGQYTLTITHAGSESAANFNFVGIPSLMIVPEYDPYYLGEDVQIAVFGANLETNVTIMLLNATTDVVHHDLMKSNNSTGYLWFTFTMDPTWNPGVYQMFALEQNGSETSKAIEILE